MFRLQSGAFAICESLLGMRVRLSHRVGLPQQVAKEAPPVVVCCWNIRLHHQHSPINFPVRVAWRLPISSNALLRYQKVAAWQNSFSREQQTRHMV